MSRGHSGRSATSPRTDVVRQAIAWDVVNWSRALRFWMRTTEIELTGATAMEVGAGENGGLSLWLASRGANVLCAAHDASLEIAADVHKRFILPGTITYGNVDALSLDCYSRYDVIAFKSVLGAIGRSDQINRQREAAARFHTALKPGGEVWFAENLVATPLHRALREKFGAARSGCRYMSLEEVPIVFERFDWCAHETAGAIALMAPSERGRTVLGYVDRVIEKVIPPRYRYIIFGIAKKL